LDIHKDKEPYMNEYTVRKLRSDDFEALSTLENDIFGQGGEKLLCPYYIRLCCDFFGDTCFLALDGEKPIGYVLSFVRDGEAYCTTLAIRPQYQRTRAIVQLLRAFLGAIIDRVDLCWFTVDQENSAARALHRMLGATEVGVRKDFYGAGDDRLVSKIDKSTFHRLRPKYERLGLVPKNSEREAKAA